jgi:hypothetical protein
VIFYGPCPILSCLDTDAHAHSVCPDCGAVNHGNIDCATCVNTWECNAESKATLLAAIERNQT